MKKIFSLLLSIVVMLTVCSCSADKKSINIDGFVPFNCSNACVFSNSKSDYYLIFDNAEFIFNGRIVYNNYGTDSGEYKVYGDNSKKGTYVLYEPDYNVEFYGFDEENSALFFKDTDNDVFYRMVIDFNDTVTAQEPTIVYRGNALPIHSQADNIVLETEEGYISFNTLNGETTDYLESRVPEIYCDQVKISPDKAIKIADDYVKSRAHNGSIDYPLDEYEPVLDALASDFLLFPDFNSPNFERFWGDVPDFCWCIVYYFGDEEFTEGWRVVYINAVDGNLFGTAFTLAD